MSDLCKLLLVVVAATTIFSCQKSDQTNKTHRKKLVKSPIEELKPLPKDPMNWKDDELKFLDDLAGSSIIGHNPEDYYKAVEKNHVDHLVYFHDVSEYGLPGTTK